MKKFAYSICLSLFFFEALSMIHAGDRLTSAEKGPKSTVDKREWSATLKAFSWIAAGFFRLHND